MKNALEDESSVFLKTELSLMGAFRYDGNSVCKVLLNVSYTSRK